MRMIPATAIRKIYLVILLIFLSASAFAQSPPAKILYVGAISINPCQDAKVLADWYSRFGIETREYKGGYYGKLDTAAGLFAFGIHPNKLMLRRTVQRVFQSYIASKISKAASGP